MSDLSHADDRRWLDQLMLELRLRDVDGTAIGDALAQVEAHCAESGESPQDAFGDAATYADALALPVRTKGPAGVARVALAGLAGYVAVGLGLRAAFNPSSASVSLTVGDVTAIAALLVAGGVLVAFLRPMLTVRWRFVAWFVVSFSAVVGLGITLRMPLLQIGLSVAVGLAAVFAVAGRGLCFWRIGSDPIRDPRR